MQATIDVCAIVSDRATGLRLAALCARQGWTFWQCTPCTDPRLSIQALPPHVDMICCDDPALYNACCAEAALRHAVVVLNADAEAATASADGLVLDMASLSDAELIEAVTTALNLRRFRQEFTGAEQAEPITRLPRYEEVLQGLELTRPTGLVVMQIDHAEHLYANLDPVSKTDLLSALSQHLQTRLPHAATMAIFDAGCFAVALPDTAAADVVAVAQSLCERGRAPVTFRGGSLHCSLSCGHAWERALRDPQRLWQAAWNAKDEARLGGGNTTVGAAEHVSIERRIPQALAHNEFSLQLQPQFTIDGHSLRGVECLLRWQGLEVGNLAPDHFIPVAERSGQMARVGDWVLERASCESATWLEQLVTPLVLGINISPQQFRNRAIVDQITRLAKDQWLDPSILELEMSHHNLLHVIDRHRSALYGLRDLGVRIAIDNLGTGVVDASKLLRCPADTLKIDRTLIARLDDPAAHQLVSHVCDLANRFQLRMVAVGVETETQRATLQSLGCGEAQGYLFSPPVPLEDFREYLSQRESSRTADG